MQEAGCLPRLMSSIPIYLQLHPEAATPLEGSSVPWTSGGETLSGPVDETVYYVSSADYHFRLRLHSQVQTVPIRPQMALSQLTFQCL